MRCPKLSVSPSLFVLLGLGCARPASEPPSSPPPAAAAVTTPASGTDVDTTLPWPDAATCAAAARTAPADPSVDDDLHTIVAGYYSPDHIGPEAFAAIEDHVRREPDAFLDAWARAALDPTSSLDRYWSNVLERTAAARPERTRELAACLLARYDDALAHPPAGRDPSWEERIGQNRLVTYLDWRARPDDGTWRVAMPSRACTTTTDGVTTLTLEVECTCGEPIACDLAADPDHLDVLVTLDLRAPAVCDDCYPSAGACTLPATQQDLAALTINGLRVPLAPCPS